jgi:hypothetical protein
MAECMCKGRWLSEMTLARIVNIFVEMLVEVIVSTQIEI